MIATSTVTTSAIYHTQAKMSGAARRAANEALRVADRGDGRQDRVADRFGLLFQVTSSGTRIIV
jgi:hypothetical protein